jgi:hypothetical protein
MFGDNRIYEVMSVKNYREGLSKLGKEGIRGFYKGNLTAILLASSNAWLRGKLYVQAGEQGLLKNEWMSNAFSIYL